MPLKLKPQLKYCKFKRLFLALQNIFLNRKLQSSQHWTPSPFPRTSLISLQTILAIFTELYSSLSRIFCPLSMDHSALCTNLSLLSLQTPLPLLQTPFCNLYRALLSCLQTLLLSLQTCLPSLQTSFCPLFRPSLPPVQIPLLFLQTSLSPLQTPLL